MEAESIKYNGKSYRLERTNSEEYPYILHGPRSAAYTLYRNKPEPHKMFVVNATGRVLRGWFSDRNGELKQIA